MESQTEKRMVSKGAYVAAKSFTLLLYIGIIFGGMCIAYFLTAIFFTWDYKTANEVADYNYARRIFWGSLFLLPPFIFVTYFLGRQGRKSWMAVRDIEPLTHANTADLPATNSLVRASSEPMQAQEAMLLRAASEGVERHEEQLVRPAGGAE